MVVVCGSHDGHYCVVAVGLVGILALLFGWLAWSACSCGSWSWCGCVFYEEEKKRMAKKRARVLL